MAECGMCEEQWFERGWRCPHGDARGEKHTKKKGICEKGLRTKQCDAATLLLYEEATLLRPRSASPLGRVTDEEDMFPTIRATCRVYNLAGEALTITYDDTKAVGWALQLAKSKWEKTEDGGYKAVLVKGLQVLKNMKTKLADLFDGYEDQQMTLSYLKVRPKHLFWTPWKQLLDAAGARTPEWEWNRNGYTYGWRDGIWGEIQE